FTPFFMMDSESKPIQIDILCARTQTLTHSKPAPV
ncbi:MAG: hypothetical protein ACI945_001486, partial [Pseudohongiellaceae bacterium]